MLKETIYFDFHHICYICLNRPAQYSGIRNNSPRKQYEEATWVGCVDCYVAPARCCYNIGITYYFTAGNCMSVCLSQTLWKFLLRSLINSSLRKLTYDITSQRNWYGTIILIRYHTIGFWRKVWYNITARCFFAMYGTVRNYDIFVVPYRSFFKLHAADLELSTSPNF